MTISLSSPNSSTAAIQKNGGNVVTFDANNNATFAGTVVSASSMGMRNRIINGDMRIDQRNAGAAVTANLSYPVDRFQMSNGTDGTFSAQQSTSIVPVGFTHSVGITITAADTSLGATQALTCVQRIEGYNVSDLAWGTANAQTVTLSFWVRSSLTGTFGGSLRNSAANRSYPFTYTISSANTWEQKSITIAGDTSGTWLTDSGVGIILAFGLGAGVDRSGTAGAWNSNNNASATGATSVVGTNGATFYITGVQLEVGSTATPFERRLYGTEFDLCRRYCEVYSNPNLNYEQDGIPQGIATVDLGGRGETQIFYYPKRASPSITVLNNNLYWQNMANTSSSCTFGGTYIGTGINSSLLFVVPSGACAVGTLSGVGLVSFTNVANKMIISAEL